MSVKQFLSDDNIKLLWDLITEEEVFKNRPNDMKNNISKMFIQNIEGFYHTEKATAKTLVELNKKYMIAILTFIRQMKPASKLEPRLDPPARLEPEKILTPQKLTHEIFQNERMSQFEKDYEKRQSEFDSAMTLPKPSVPEFSDKMNDEPLKNMEEILKQMTAQRNYDIYNITQSQQNGNANPNFLKPMETSVKNEKLMQKEFAETVVSSKLKPINTRPNSEQNNNIRYIKIDNQDLDKSIINQQVIELPTDNDSPKKQLTWGENQVYYQDKDKDEEIDLFKRLKKNNIAHETPDFQRQIDELNTKVDNINININMILDLLRKKSEN